MTPFIPKFRKELSFLALLCSINISLFAQCVVPTGGNALIGGSVGCASCTAAADGDDISGGATRCVTSNVGTFANYTISNGTLRVCSGGTLTISNIAFSSVGTCRIIIESGGSLTITDAQGTTSGDFSYSDNNSIENYGTLTFSGGMNLGSGTSTRGYIYTGTKGTTNFNGNLQIDMQRGLINAGTVNITGTLTLSSGSSPLICLDRSAMTVGAVTNNITNSIGWGGLSAAKDTAIINYSGTQNYLWIPLIDNARIRLCRSGGSNDLCASGCANQYGSATYKSSTCTAPLPVVLSKFYAKPKNNSAEVVWVTAQEYNNDYFELQRSYDGNHWETIANIKGQGSKSSSTTYIYADTDVDMTDNVYYKLKQVDYDDNFSYSNTISLHSSHSDLNVAIYPNPIEEGTKLYAKFSDIENGTAWITVFDVTGKIVTNYTIDDIYPGGIYLINDKELTLPQGSYYLQVKSMQKVYTEKLLVK